MSTAVTKKGFFTRTPVSIDPLYLYGKPFVVADTHQARETYLFDYFGDTERADEVKFREILLKFAVQEKLVEVITDKLVPSTNQDIGSWIWAVNWLNFRSLIDMHQYADLMTSLQSHGNDPINQLLELHARLGMLFDERLLNALANRTMRSVQLIPYEVVEGREIIDWERIHLETPFIWLLIFLQVIIRSTAVKL